MHIGVGGYRARRPVLDMTVRSLCESIQRATCVARARVALALADPERALRVLEEPGLSGYGVALRLRGRALAALYERACARSHSGRASSAYRLLDLAARYDRGATAVRRRALLWRVFTSSDGAPGGRPSEAMRELLSRLRGSGAGKPGGGKSDNRHRGGAASENDRDSLRFHLAVDEGGELFVVSGTSVSVGHARSGVADIPLLADLESVHARFSYVESFHAGPAWRLHGEEGCRVQVDGEEQGGGEPLRDGSFVKLASNLEFLFRIPDPASASAVLELQHGVEAEGARRILLFVPGKTGRVRIGSRADCHMPVTRLDHEIILEVERDQEQAELWIQCEGGVRKAGMAEQVATRLGAGLPPLERQDFFLGARPTQSAPYCVSLVPVEPGRMGPDA